MGKDYFELFIPEDVRNDVAADMNKVLKGELTGGFESKVFAHDRKERILAWYVDYIFDAKGKPCGVIAFGQDITERKQIRESITKAKIEWEMTFDSVMELILLVDKEFNIIRCNKSFAEFAGVPIKELIGHKCYEYLSHSDPEQFEHCRELIERGEPVPRTEVNTKTGHWFYVSSSPILDKKGKFLHTVITATDITELKKAQQRLVESEKKLKKRIGELEKFYEMAVDRELRIKEMKKEIKELESELSQYKKDDGNER